MIKLTELGKKIYGDFEIEVDIETEFCVIRIKNSKLYKGTQIAQNPTDLKSLLDMGLIEFENVDNSKDINK